jgi:hypothetical protein
VVLAIFEGLFFLCTIWIRYEIKRAKTLQQDLTNILDQTTDMLSATASAVPSSTTTTTTATTIRTPITTTLASHTAAVSILRDTREENDAL